MADSRWPPMNVVGTSNMLGNCLMAVSFGSLTKRWKQSGVLLLSETKRGSGRASFKRPLRYCTGRAGTGTVRLWLEQRRSRPEIEFETVRFRAQLARTLAGEGDPPRLEFRHP